MLLELAGKTRRERPPGLQIWMPTTRTFFTQRELFKANPQHIPSSAQHQEVPLNQVSGTCTINIAKRSARGDESGEIKTVLGQTRIVRNCPRTIIVLGQNSS